MSIKTSFSDKLLIQAAIDYSYRMSRFDIAKDPVETTTNLLLKDFDKRYKPVLIENQPIVREDKNNKQVLIQLRYLIIEDTYSNPIQHALIFQGSDTNYETILSGKDTDWSNNFSNAVHLSESNFQQAKNEYLYLKKLNKYNITAAAGNSLGGAYALSLADIDADLRIIGVNPAPPLFGTKYTDSDNSTIINTNTDLLTRMLNTDISRYKKADVKKIKKVFANESLSDIEKTKIIDQMISDLDYQVGFYYGLKSYPVERSLYYNEAMYVEASHRGTFLEPRELVLDIFRNNKALYSSSYASKIFTETSQLLDYSRYFIKLSTNTLNKDEYRDLLDNYIEPAFLPVHRNKVNDYREFTSLAEFIQYDLKDKNLINQDGTPTIYTPNWKIDDKDSFIKNLNTSVNDYKNSLKYPLNRVIHDLEEEHFINVENNDIKPKLNFFLGSFNLGVNFDINFDILGFFTSLPVQIIYKLFEMIEQNWRYFKGLRNNINNYFIENKDKLLNVKTVSEYRSIYKLANESIEHSVKVIITNFNRLTNNLDKALKIDDRIWLFKSNKLLKSFDKMIPLDLNLNLKAEKFKNLDENLVTKQQENILKIIDDYRIFSVKELSTTIKRSEEILSSGIDLIDRRYKRKETENLEKLSKQLTAMLNNVDLETIYFNALNVFSHDLASFVLKNTVAQSIVTHYLQIIETNNQALSTINNLRFYVENNTKHKLKKTLLLDLDQIEKDILTLNTYIEYFIK